MTTRPAGATRPGGHCIGALGAGRLLPLLAASLLACDGGAGDRRPERSSGGATVTDTAPDALPDPRSPDPDTGGPDTGAWGFEARGEDSGGAMARVVDVRAAPHDGYDRLVLEFSGAMPAWTVLYPDRPPRHCGSGHPVEHGAEYVLQVELRPAAAHDEQGRGTVEPRSLEPGLDVLRSARVTCDFEGIVEWVLGLERRMPFRAFTLDRPPRLAVDVRHP